MATSDQTTLSEIKDMMGELVKTPNNVVTRLESISADVSSVSRRLQEVERKMEFVIGSRTDEGCSTSSQAQLVRQIGRIREDIAVVTSYGNANHNLIFHGIAREGETTDFSVRKFLLEVILLDLHTVQSIQFSDIHTEASTNVPQ